MKLLLDTDICIYLIKARPTEVLARFHEHTPGDIGISVITLAELEYGAARSQYPKKNRIALAGFFTPLVVAALEPAVAVTYGKIRAALEAAGRPIGPLDTLIAAHALTLGVPLVTNNEREFQRVKGLQVENWTR